MTTAITYTGDLRCECVHIQSGTKMETDAPTDNKGKGARFSPTDSVCMALGTCMITTMAIRGMDRNVDFSGTKLEVTKHMIADPRRIGKIDVTLSIITNRTLSAEEIEYFVGVGDNCPVMKSIHPDIKVNPTYNWIKEV